MGSLMSSPPTCDEPPVHSIRLDHNEAQLLTRQGGRGAVSKGSGGKACKTAMCTAGGPVRDSSALRA
jgi:hypothetical protein